MEIREGMKKVVRGVATGGSIAALLTLGMPAVASVADLDSQPLTSGYNCPPEAGCGGKDKDEKKDGKKGDKKDKKKGKKEGKCGEGKCGEGKCG